MPVKAHNDEENRRFLSAVFNILRNLYFSFLQEIFVKIFRSYFVTLFVRINKKGVLTIRILHFITDTNIGGAGRLLCNQIKNMNTDEFEIFVALPQNSSLMGELALLPCETVPLSGSADRSFNLSDVGECLGVIKKVKPDIVHSHSSLSSRISASLLSMPCRVFTRHCTFPLSPIMTSPISKLVIGGVNSLLSTSIIAVAEAAKNDLIATGCNERSIHTIINGVEPIEVISEDEKEFVRSRYGIRGGDFVIGIFARLESYKGHSDLLRAARICKRYYSNFRFLIVGDGTLMGELKELAVKLGVDEMCLFVGFCRDVTPLFNIIDVNANCSFGTETSSLSLSEGMSLGIPAVASDFGGNTYMVKNAENGLIYPKQNAEALAMALIRLYRDKELYKKCSAGAYRRYREELNARSMTEKMMEFYRQEYARSKSKRTRKTSEK